MSPSRYAASLLALAFLAAPASVSAACTLPHDLQNGDLADANALNGNFTASAGCADMIAPAGSTNAIQYNAGGGTPGGTGPLLDGQTLIGSTGNPPQAARLTAGSGIAITNGAGSITITTTGSGTGANVDWLDKPAVVQPVAASFTLRTSTTAPAGAAKTATSRGMLLVTDTIENNRAIMADVAVPAGNWQATMLSVYTGGLSGYILPGIAVRDSTTSRAVTFGIGGRASEYRFDYTRTAGGSGLDSFSSDGEILDAGFPVPSQPIWSRLTFDGTSLIWSFSRDGESFTPVYAVSASDWLSQLETIGPAVLFYQPSNPGWNNGFHILSWSLVSI